MTKDQQKAKILAAIAAVELKRGEILSFVGGTLSLEILPSELESIRDFLNRVIPTDEVRRLREEATLRGPAGLRLVYEIREALGWNDKTSLSILPTGVRDLRKALTEIRKHVADDVARLEEMKACGDLTRDVGELILSHDRMTLSEIDRILAVNRINGIAP